MHKFFVILQAFKVAALLPLLYLTWEVEFHSMLLLDSLSAPVYDPPLMWCEIDFDKEVEWLNFTTT